MLNVKCIWKQIKKINKHSVVTNTYCIVKSIIGTTQHKLGYKKDK